jgi:hypothetical protein
MSGHRRRLGLLASLEVIRRTPLDMISVSQAGDVARDICERQSDEHPFGVAGFGSAI